MRWFDKARAKWRSAGGYVEDVAVDRSIEWEGKYPPETVDSETFDYAAEDAVIEGSGCIARQPF